MYDTPTATISFNYWLMPNIRPVELTAERIIKATCKAFDLDKEILVSACRKNEVVRARNICMYLIRKKLKISKAETGRLFNRDHTTVIHSIRWVDIELSMAHTRQRVNEDLRRVMQLI